MKYFTMNEILKQAIKLIKKKKVKGKLFITLNKIDFRLNKLKF